jgi:hypothetical protein
MVRIVEVAGDTKVTYPSPIARRRRPKVTGPPESGFVLILVLPVAMLLLMTALSLVSRSNSAAVASANESRAQAARMAAEFGLNQVMAQVNTLNGPAELLALVDVPRTIDLLPNGSPATKYTIRAFNPPEPDPTPRYCPDFNSDNNLNVTIEGSLTDNSGTTYTQPISRTLKVCVPNGADDQLRVRAIR